MSNMTNEKTLAAILADERMAVRAEADEDKMISPESVLLLIDRIEAGADRMRDAYCELCQEKDEAYDRLLLERDKAIKVNAISDELLNQACNIIICYQAADADGEYSHQDSEVNEWFKKLKKIEHVLSSQSHKGKWKNGRNYEYEYAYCSECGRMQWAGWNSHKEAEKNIESFADDYRFCPGCGAEMEGGEYVK